MSLERLISMTRRYGGDRRYVIAGGGNSSWKDGATLYVKGSGTEMGKADEASFVAMDRRSLASIWEREYSSDSDRREEEVLADLMAARLEPDKGQRPSVETLLHDLIPHKFVMHTHPALINGLTCSKRGKDAAEEIFGDKVIWIEVTNPGYVLAALVKERMDRYIDIHGEVPHLILLQNHGIFVSHDDPDEIDHLYSWVCKKVGSHIGRFPDHSPREMKGEERRQISRALMSLPGKMRICPFGNGELLSFGASEGDFYPLSLAPTPDHIVYGGFKPLYCSKPEHFKEDLHAYMEKEGERPKLAFIKSLGAFAFADCEQGAKKAKLLFLDALDIAVYSESFGGISFMDKDKIDFIRSWEAEKYRSKAGSC